MHQQSASVLMKVLKAFVSSPSSHLHVSLPLSAPDTGFNDQLISEPIHLAVDTRAPELCFFLLFRVGIIHQLVFSSEVTLKGLSVVFLVSALSRRSCQYIYQSNHHGPDGGVWLPSHFSLLDNLLISFPGSTRFILIKLLSATTPEMPPGHPGRAACSPPSPLNTSGSPACSQPRGLLTLKTFYHFDKADLEQPQRDCSLSLPSSWLVANTGSSADPGKAGSKG